MGWNSDLFPPLGALIHQLLAHNFLLRTPIHHSLPTSLLSSLPFPKSTSASLSFNTNQRISSMFVNFLTILNFCKNELQNPMDPRYFAKLHPISLVHIPCGSEGIRLALHS